VTAKVKIYTRNRDTNNYKSYDRFFKVNYYILLSGRFATPHKHEFGVRGNPMSIFYIIGVIVVVVVIAGYLGVHI